MEMKKNGLILSVGRNPKLCPEASCTEKNNYIVPVLAAALSFSLLLTAMAILWNLKTRHQVGKRNGSLELRNLRFSYSDLVRITDNFERALGKGGFGTVYHGYLDDTQVAVKMLSPSSVQGYKQFQAEVKLLMRVHHKNLTTLVGYCDEGINMGLIYEFMANGNLETHLLAQDDANIFSWEGRLRIAVEAAQGWNYQICNFLFPPIFVKNLYIKNIVDPRLQGDFDINSVRKAVEIAMACISPTATKRPTMTKVVIELNECLAMEIARQKVDNDIESKDSIELYNSDHRA
ncbi:hypothetical protein Pint_29480 [Pistacia integerrima]|uniref:Uncharacterized protein n=1 Tax=Pistacia integerrima TaxID=434235 RepID=A0ACC0X175_9ROSI|nr:hypothetical protein Pint_29480 [Pistacia integerrima]